MCTNPSTPLPWNPQAISAKLDKRKSESPSLFGAKTQFSIMIDWDTNILSYKRLLKPETTIVVSAQTDFVANADRLLFRPQWTCSHRRKSVFIGVMENHYFFAHFSRFFLSPSWFFFLFVTFSSIGSNRNSQCYNNPLRSLRRWWTTDSFPVCIRSLVSVLASGLYMERFILSCVDWLGKTHVSLTCVHSAGWPQCWRRLR